MHDEPGTLTIRVVSARPERVDSFLAAIG